MTPLYETTDRFWLVFILTICILCALYGCGGSFANDPEPESESAECTMQPTPQFVGPILSCESAR